MTVKEDFEKFLEENYEDWVGTSYQDDAEPIWNAGDKNGAKRILDKVHKLVNRLYKGDPDVLEIIDTELKLLL